MRKIVRLGSGKYGSVFCLIEIKQGELSICGVEGPQPNGDAKGGCGQICGHIEIKDYAPGWDKEKVLDFIRVWDDWHLNHLRAGCEHQRENWDPTTKIQAPHPYKSGEMETKTAGWVKPSEHPLGILTKKCPECGYAYGSAWLKEALPEHIEQYLIDLSETDITPAWV